MENHIYKGVLPGKAAVMQICGNTSLCHAMHIFHSGITSLQFLLEDSTLVKVGVGISSDCAEVLRDYNESVKSVDDLSYHANQKLGGEPKTWGLRSSKDSCLQRGIYHIMLRCLLSKGHLFGSPSCIFESLFLIVYVVLQFYQVTGPSTVSKKYWEYKLVPALFYGNVGPACF